MRLFLSAIDPHTESTSESYSCTHQVTLYSAWYSKIIQMYLTQLLPLQLFPRRVEFT